MEQPSQSLTSGSGQVSESSNQPSSLPAENVAGPASANPSHHPMTGTQVPLTDVEEQNLKDSLTRLDAENFMKVVCLVHETYPEIQDKIEDIELNQLSSSLLATLKAIVESVSASSAQETGQIDVPMADQPGSEESSSLKRKRPTVEEHDRSLKRLREELVKLKEQPASQPGAPHLDADDDKCEVDEDEDEDMSSEVSEGRDLIEDLETALESNFNFKGSFYHSSNSTTAPNPGLYIEGLGLIGLPLSSREAQHIKAAASQAPYGHGAETVVNKEVRDTWEIEPKCVKFKNSAWRRWIDENVVPTVWNSLVGSAMRTIPRCELYKLLLYEEGSHFHAHQDTQKEPGMFATVVIVLPSPYTGGQIHLSHASSKKVIDFAADSMFNTSVLSWYTDVTHEVKPVQSGWRLALSYNLVNNANSLLPSLPDRGEAERAFLHVLRKWHRGAYENSDEPPGDYVGYLLDHQYSPMELRNGAACLKGRDAHRLQHIQDAAEEVGYMICLGSLEHHVSGDADGYGGYGYGDDSEDEDECPGMGEVSDTETSLENVVDLSGFEVSSSLEVDLERDFIPRNPFEDSDPDQEEYEGYMGNGAGGVEHWYRRTVMILVHSDNASSIYDRGMGIGYPFRKFKQAASSSDSSDASNWAYQLAPFVRGRRDLSESLLDYAQQKQDTLLWERVMVELPVKESEERLTQGWKEFGFEVVSGMLKRKLSNMKGLKAKQALIQFIAAKEPAVQPWCSEQTHQIFLTLDVTHIKAEDIPTVLDYALEQGNREIWGKMIINLPSHYNEKDDRITQGWSRFGFNAVSPIFEKKLSTPRNLRERQTLIEFVGNAEASPEDKPVIDVWCSVMTDQVLRTLSSPSVEEVPLYISICQSKGIQFMTETVLPQFQKLPNLKAFWIAFVKALHSQRTTFAPEAVDSLIEKCLEVLLPLWSVVPPSHGYYVAAAAQAQSNKTKIANITELIDVCLLTSQTASSKSLLSLVLRNSTSRGSIDGKLIREFFEPLILELRMSLHKYGKDLSEQPFAGMVQFVVGQYLRHVLGPAPTGRTRPSRPLGCGCHDCSALDRFMLAPSETQTFRYKQNIRIHLEKRLAGGTDLVTWNTIRSGQPHGLSVTKRKDVIDGQRWSAKKVEAKAFFGKIGDETMLAKILGDSFADFERVVSGQIGPLPTTTFPTPATNQTPRPAPPVLQGSTVTNVPSANSTTTVQPRTKATSQNTGVVIDLTLDD